jgi:hypothetical protein
VSYKVAFFGVPATMSAGDVLAQVVPMAQELRMENGYEQVYMVATPEVVARKVGLRVLYFAAPGARGGVSREFFTERWNGPFFEMVYDDQHGLFLWRYFSGDGAPQTILTDGHRVGLSKGFTPNADYPQKGFTNAQLDNSFRKPEAELTPAEARALMEYHDAITIGLAHHGVALKRAALLDLLYAERAWALLDEPPRPQPLPRDAAPVASFYIEPYEFSAYGLEPRRY